MLCNLVAGEDHLFLAVAQAEIIHMVPTLVTIPASAGIFFLQHEHPRPIGLEIRIPISPWRRRKAASALPFQERETVEIRWCGRQDSNLHSFPSGF